MKMYCEMYGKVGYLKLDGNKYWSQGQVNVRDSRFYN